MELIRISDCKLKIMLTPTDMCHFELNPDNFGEDRVQLHRTFRLLFGEIRKQIGFEADDNRVSVQYFPSKGGGCEMFISNLQPEEEHRRELQAFLAPVKAQADETRTAKKRSGGFRRDCAYRFSQLSHLLRACRRLLGVSCVCESSAYRDEGGDYFLFLTVLSNAPYTLPEEIEFLAEYAGAENAAQLRLYIKEHATTVCNANAISKLARLA